MSKEAVLNQTIHELVQANVELRCMIFECEKQATGYLTEIAELKKKLDIANRLVEKHTNLQAPEADAA